MGNKTCKGLEEPSSLYLLAFDAVTCGRVDKLEQYASEIPQLFEARKDGKSLLHWAVLHLQANCVKFLLQKGVDPNISDKWGYTPLMEIAHCKAKDTAKFKTVIELLVKSNADLNAVEAHKRTALLQTIIHFKNSAAEILLDLGADPNLGDIDGLRPLHVCSTYANVSLLRKVIAKKADINAQDSKKRTALYCAVLAGNQKVVEELLRHGVDVDLPSVYGCPLQIAVVKRKYDSLVSLLHHGACVNFTVNEQRHSYSKAKDCVNLAILVLQSEICELETTLKNKTVEEIAHMPTPDKLQRAIEILDLIVQAHGDNVVVAKNVLYLYKAALVVFKQPESAVYSHLRKLCVQWQFLHAVNNNQPPMPAYHTPRDAGCEDYLSLQNLCRMKLRRSLTGKRSNVLYGVKYLDCTAVVKDILLLKDII